MKNEIAIELGSTNLRIYQKNKGLLFCEPNMIIYKKIESKIKPIAYGKDAKKREGKLLNDEKIIYPIIIGALKDINAQKDILELVFDKLNIKLSNTKFIFCVSSGIDEKGMLDYHKLLEKLKIKNYEFMFQPVCISKNIKSLSSQPRFIVDIGAGKTELAIILNGEVVKGICLDIGGNIFNIGINEILKVDKNLLASNYEIEQLKNNIGSLYATDNAQYKICAKNLDTQLIDSYIIKAKDFNSVLIDCHEKIITLIKAMIADATPEIASSISKDAIYFAGDSAKLIGLQSYYENKLKIKIKLLSSYGDSVVEGATKYFF